MLWCLGPLIPTWVKRLPPRFFTRVLHFNTRARNIYFNHRQIWEWWQPIHTSWFYEHTHDIILIPGWGGDSRPLLRLLLLTVSNYEGGRAFKRSGVFAGTLGSTTMFPENPDMSTEGVEERGDIYLLQGLFTVVQGHQDIWGTDVARLLQAAVHAWPSHRGNTHIHTYIMHSIPLYYKLICLFIWFNYLICESCFVELFPRTCKTLSITSHSPRENVSTLSRRVHTELFVWARHQMHTWLNLSATSMNLKAGYYRLLLLTPMNKCS